MEKFNLKLVLKENCLESIMKQVDPLWSGNKLSPLKSKKFLVYKCSISSKLYSCWPDDCARSKAKQRFNKSLE